MVIVVASGNRIAQSLRNRFGRLFPQSKVSSLTPTPTPISVGSLATTPSKSGQTKGEQTAQMPQAERIPSSGPSDIVYVAIAGSALVGLFAQILTRKPR